MSKRELIVLTLLLMFVARVAHAGDVLYFNADERPDPHVVADILSGAAKAVRPVKMRSIRLLGEPAVANATPPAEAVASIAAEPPSGMALPVQFAFDSVRLLPGATAQLDAVAEGIKLAGDGVTVLIEGHTDAKGAEDYNLKLSLLRAAAVKSYLVSHHGIDPARLRVEGRGEFAPISRDPFAPENRRVEFRGVQG